MNLFVKYVSLLFLVVSCSEQTTTPVLKILEIETDTFAIIDLPSDFNDLNNSY